MSLIGLLVAEMAIRLVLEYTHFVCGKMELHSFRFSKVVVHRCKSILLVMIVIVDFKSVFVMARSDHNL